jgi:hypothetical protein
MSPISAPARATSAPAATNLAAGTATTPDRDATASAAPAPDEDRPPAEAVEVRTEGLGHLEQPSQLLWQGRLFLVRHALRLAGGHPTPGDQDVTGERWRLLVGDGPGRTASVVVVRRSGGGWLLHRDAA